MTFVPRNHATRETIASVGMLGGFYAQVLRRHVKHQPSKRRTCTSRYSGALGTRTINAHITAMTCCRTFMGPARMNGMPGRRAGAGRSGKCTREAECGSEGMSSIECTADVGLVGGPDARMGSGAGSSDDERGA